MPLLNHSSSPEAPSRRALSASALGLGLSLALSVSASLVWSQDRPDLRVAVNALGNSLESAEAQGNVDVRVTYSMFDTLIRRDFLADGSGTTAILVPSLAESWRQIDDVTWEFKLREGVKFHNGDELVSDDVVFSFMPGRIVGYRPILPGARSRIGPIKFAYPVDKYTVRIVTEVPDPAFLQRMASYSTWIVNAKDYMLRGKDAFARNPVGTGPYMLDEWVDGEFIRLKAHDEYFGGRPTADTVTFSVVPEVSGRIAGIVSGEFDIAVNIPPDQIPTLERYDDVETKSIVLDNTHVLWFYADEPHMQDKRIRQALSLAIDRDLLRKALWDDRNYTPNGHQLPSYPLYLADYPAFEYNPEKARALLAEAGYDGTPIVYRLPGGYYLNSTEAAQAMEQMWEAAGFNIQLEVVENWTLTLADGVNIRPHSNTHSIPDPLGSFINQWGKRGGGQNNRDFPDRVWVPGERFTELEAVVAGSLDVEARAEAFREMLDIWVDEVPGTLLYNPLETYAVRSDVQWQPYSLYYMDFRPTNLQFAE